MADHGLFGFLAKKKFVTVKWEYVWELGGECEKLERGKGRGKMT